jgi:tetratricopeptide (TPR) repeat protein
MTFRLFKNILILSISFFFSFSNSIGQTAVSTEVHLLTDENTGELTLEHEQFFDYVKVTMSILEEELGKSKTGRDVLVMFTLSQDQKPQIRISARPVLDKKTSKNLQNIVNQFSDIRTGYVDFSFAYVFTVNGGNTDSKQTYKPDPIDPSEHEFNRFNNLSMIDKQADIQQFMRLKLLPMMGQTMANVPEQFEGVAKFGKLILSDGWKKRPIANLTDQNYDYWRAVLEMERGNLIVPFAKACLHIEKGQYDIASNILSIISPFWGETKFSKDLVNEVSIKLDLLKAQIDAEVEKGIAMHDKKQYQKAINHYENIRKDFPNSAWLNYELYFSKSMLLSNDEEVKKLWTSMKSLVFEANPVYPMEIRAENGRKAYLLFRRQEINSLFKEGGDVFADFINYADITLELGEYGFAAQLYWLILSYFPKEKYGERNMLSHFVYCMHKMGQQKIVELFEIDLKRELEDIESAFEKRMLTSPIYNSFKNE